MLWVAERFLGGLPALGRFDAASGNFVSDYFPGVLTNDMAATNDGGVRRSSGSRPDSRSCAWIRPAPFFPRRRRRASLAPSRPRRPASGSRKSPISGIGRIGRIQFPALAQFTVPTTGELVDIAEGPDGGIWFTDTGANRVARLSPDGTTLVGYAVPTAEAFPHGIVAGPDGNLWFTMRDANKLGFITTAGEISRNFASRQPRADRRALRRVPTEHLVHGDGFRKIGRVALPAIAPEPEAVPEPEQAEGRGR